MELQEEVIAIISKSLCVDKEKLNLETQFEDDLNADSLDMVEMIMAIEDKFKIDIPEDDIENIKTIGDVVEYINKKAA